MGGRGGRGAGEEGGVGVEDGDAAERARGEGWEGELLDTGGGGRGAANRWPPRGRRRSALRVPALTHAAAVDAPRRHDWPGGRGGGADRGGRKNQARRARGGGDGWCSQGRGGGELRGTQRAPQPQRGGPARKQRAPPDVTGTGAAACGGGAPAAAQRWGPRPRPPLAAHLSQPTHEPHGRKERRHSLPAKAGLGGGGGGPAWRHGQRSHQVERRPARGPARRFPELTGSRDSVCWLPKKPVRGADNRGGPAGICHRWYSHYSTI